MQPYSTDVCCTEDKINPRTTPGGILDSYCHQPAAYTRGSRCLNRMDHKPTQFFWVGEAIRMILPEGPGQSQNTHWGRCPGSVLPVTTPSQQQGCGWQRLAPAGAVAGVWPRAAPSPHQALAHPTAPARCAAEYRREPQQLRGASVVCGGNSPLGCPL